MAERIVISLDDHAAEFLRKEAAADARKPAGLARLLVLRGLRERGLVDDPAAAAIDRAEEEAGNRGWEDEL